VSERRPYALVCEQRAGLWIADAELLAEAVGGTLVSGVSATRRERDMRRDPLTRGHGHAKIVVRGHDGAQDPGSTDSGSDLKSDAWAPMWSRSRAALAGPWVGSSW
jgi:hypothetical protein